MKEVLQSVLLQQKSQNSKNSQNGNVKINVVPSVKFMNSMIEKLKETNERKNQFYEEKMIRLEKQVE